MRTPQARRFGVLLSAAALVLLQTRAGYGNDADDLTELERRFAKKAEASARSGLFREYAIKALTTKQTGRALTVLSDFFLQQLGKRGARLNGPRMDILSSAADPFLLLRICHDKRSTFTFRRDVAEWLFASDEHVSLFLSVVPLDGDWALSSRLIETLYDHDPEGREQFLKLILALSVVWDRPRPPLHFQMGAGGMLPFEVNITERYDHFKWLYRKRKAKIPYRDLSVTALTFVVDLPVPMSEIRWALENVRGAANGWQKKFDDIRYDKGRIARQAYQWPHGAYTLAAIRELGGICVDQAYYATITARAYGIPALIFVGEGRRGPHAWFGYLKDRGRWELDAGRYRYDKYATGRAYDPRLKRPMTDHDLEYACARALHSSTHAKATRYGRLAVVLLGLGFLEDAADCANACIDLTRIYDLPWRVLEDVLTRQKKPEQLLKLLDRKANAFRGYPDYVAGIRQQQAEILRGLGRTREAEELLTRQERRLRSKRDDLSRFLVTDQIRAAYEAGDHVQARTKMEELLRNQKHEGQKVMALLQAYIGLTDATKQTKEAARFLRRFLDSMRRRYGDNPHNEAIFLQMQLKAYENDGDERNAKRIRKKLDGLRGR